MLSTDDGWCADDDKEMESSVVATDAAEGTAKKSEK